jgi:hypothetical protein
MPFVAAVAEIVHAAKIEQHREPEIRFVPEFPATVEEIARRDAVGQLADGGRQALEFVAETLDDDGVEIVILF